MTIDRITSEPAVAVPIGTRAEARALDLDQDDLERAGDEVGHRVAPQGSWSGCHVLAPAQ